ncbi:hypothetical protein HYU07_01520 [Candidatus Woesearchaeota archaeon]|nr:hypothetical protein [Candidatus Woesearchaeota archaeon]
MNAKTKLIAGLALIVLVIFSLAIILNTSKKQMPMLANENMLPSFVMNNYKNKLAYSIALDRQDDFMHEMQHRGKTIPIMHSLKECFINEDGSWQDHAAIDCPACVAIALKADELLKQGMSLKETREYIDTKYVDQRYTDMGTKTPLPP